ncbi:MAG: hypothetical protein A2076_09860 [Geobacteraceae bacterium GWC2_53_11]|nr:MAG: hypothetical protein A2076_09860 [Geobacteraceae bacterium GWC2_53_11]
MKIQAILKTLCIMILGTLLGCGGGGGGGGGGGSTPPTSVAAKTSVSGTVSFPSLSSLVGKQVSKTVALALPAGTTVKAYTLDGTFVGEATGANLNLATGAFTISDLAPGADYVIKAVSGGQVLRKLVEKALVAPNAEVPSQDLSAVSTAAVTVASQKLGTDAGLTNLVLGEPTVLTATQKTTLSERIFTDVSPQALEQQITDAQTTMKAAISSGNYTAINTQSLIDLVNTLNVVIAAIDKNTDPTKLMNDSTLSIDVTTSDVKQFTLAAPSTPTTLTTVTQAVVAPIITKSIDTYVPPSRVQLDISTDVPAGTLYGLILDITMPVAATMPAVSITSTAAELSFLELETKLRLAAGVDQNASIKVLYWDVSSRKMRLQIASGYPLTGPLFSFLTDRTTGQTLSAVDFTVTTVKATDENGTALASGINFGKTVTSSGL